MPNRRIQAAEPARNLIALRITDSELAKLKAFADASGQSVTDVHRAVLAEFIASIESRAGIDPRSNNPKPQNV